MQAWDELVFLPPPAKPCTPHQSGHLGYIRGCMVDLGRALPLLHFRISEPDRVHLHGTGPTVQGNMLAYDPATNGDKWIPMQGSAGNLSPAEEASMRELSNIVPHDPSEVLQRMDCFGEQRGESGMQEAMELGYQPGSEGDAGSDSSDGPHSPRHTAQHSSLRCRHQSSVSWVDQCPSESDHHVPGGAGDASCKTTNKSEGEEQPSQPDSPRDGDDPAEGSALSRQESLGATSVGGNPPGDSQEEVVIHMMEEEINSLC